nr:hypothetical protein [Tanacetum cinerariifolium]
MVMVDGDCYDEGGVAVMVLMLAVESHRKSGDDVEMVWIGGCSGGIGGGVGGVIGGGVADCGWGGDEDDAAVVVDEEVAAARGGEWCGRSCRSGWEERFWGSPKKFSGDEGGVGGCRRLTGSGEGVGGGVCVL